MRVLERLSVERVDKAFDGVGIFFVAVLAIRVRRARIAREQGTHRTQRLSHEMRQREQVKRASDRGKGKVVLFESRVQRVQHCASKRRDTFGTQQYLLLHRLHHLPRRPKLKRLRVK